MGIRENFKRGSIEMLILFLLSEEDMYGYQLAQEINLRSTGLFDITEGSMYPTLYRLLDRKAISDKKQLIGKRRTRVYYHIEPAGKELLQDMIEEYRAINTGIENIMSTAGISVNIVPKQPGRKPKGQNDTNDTSDTPEEN